MKSGGSRGEGEGVRQKKLECGEKEEDLGQEGWKVSRKCSVGGRWMG